MPENRDELFRKMQRNMLIASLPGTINEIMTNTIKNSMITNGNNIYPFVLGSTGFGKTMIGYVPSWYGKPLEPRWKMILRKVWNSTIGAFY